MGIEAGQVIGDYEVLGQIGAGGMGDVYRVRNVISERIDAMKVLRPQAGSAPDAAGRFLREIKLHASLKHPNIAVLYTAMRFEDQILMFMEMVEGIGLDQRLRRGWLGPEEAIQYVSQCLMALEYAHQRGVVHRDIKPSNLILTPGGVKLLDFGIARSTKDLALTGAGTAVGSVHYMSPEQALGEDVDARSDLYSTGVMLYEMLVGARPFAGDNAYSILNAHIAQEPLSPADLNPALPPSLCEAVLKAMRKRREDRFQTAAAFRAALQETAGVETRSMPHLPHIPHLPHVPPPPPAGGVDSSTASRLTALLADEVGPIASRVVKQTCAQTTDVREVCHRIAAEIANETSRKRFLKKCERELQLPPLESSTSPSISGRTQAVASAARPGAWDPQTLDRARKALAEQVGPMAKIIVDKASKKCRSVDELYALLAEEIETPAGRARFLATKPLN